MHLFHFNRVETYRSHMAFPLSPHRKTVYDFIYPTKGHSVRSKGLDNYEFGANSFFFLPAYQITAHEWISEDAEGYCCHFDAQIIHKNFSKYDFSNIYQKLNVADYAGLHTAEHPVPHPGVL